MARPTGRPIRDELVQAARDLIQTRGVGEFSYGALADAIGIRAPSIHHHFPRKEQLVAEVAAQYRTGFDALVGEIDTSSPTEAIVAYSAMYATTASSGRTCLCGAIAAEWASVGEEVHAEVSRFFAEQIEWLRTRITEAQRLGEIRRTDVNPLAFARTIFACLQGALVLARSDADFGNTTGAVRDLLVHAAAQP